MGARLLSVGEGSYKYRKAEINITKRDKIYHMFPDMRIHHRFFGIPAKNSQPDSNHKETLDKSKLREILQNIWQNIKMLRLGKTKKG